MSDSDSDGSKAGTEEQKEVSANETSGSESGSEQPTTKDAPVDSASHSSAPGTPEANIQSQEDEKKSSGDDSNAGEGLTMKPIKRNAVQSDSDQSDANEGGTAINAIESDSEKEDTDRVAGPEKKVVSQKDLFGDDADLSDTGDEKEKQEEGKDEEAEEKNEDSDDGIHGIRMEIPEDDEQNESAPAETVIQVEVPRIEADLGNSLHFVKFPNFLSVETRPFDADNYEDEIDEDEVLDEEGRSRLKLKVENTIRWRQSVDGEGNPTKQSNAKIVRWSDGTMSLYLGSEIFDVHVQPTPGDYNHLFVRQGAGLQGQAVFRTKLTFRPHSTDTMTHRKMTLSMADRTSKAQKVKVLAEVGKNPEKEKEELVRREEERLRATARRESQQRKIRERSLGGRGMGRDLLEPDEFSDDDSINAIKKSYKPGGHHFFGQGIRDLTTADSDDDSESGNRLEKAKKLSSDDDEEGASGSATAPKKRKIIEDDDDEDED